MTPARLAFATATAFVALVVASAESAAQTPSFDCRSAKLPDEQIICAQPLLAELDQLMNRGFLYLRAAKGDADARAIGSPLLSRRIACGGDEGCIARAQVDAIKVYQAFGAPVTIPSNASEELKRLGAR